MTNIVRRLKTLLKAALDDVPFVTLDMSCAKERFGSDYGGWDIMTANIDNRSVIYSFGIGEDASFDIALIDTFNLAVHAFDPTPRSIEWVRKQGFSDRFIMHDYGIAAFDGTAPFNPPENPEHVSHTMLDRPSTSAKAITVPVKRLSTIMKELEHDHIDILKMDIEGAEYDIINDLRRSGIRPAQILVEFHHRFPGVGIKKTKKAVGRLRSWGYRLFSVSASKEEFCFIRNPGCTSQRKEHV